MRTSKRKIIIDTDLGVDDAWALILALASDELEILGITTVFGNVEAFQAAQNVIHILAKMGKKQIPVLTGSERPIVPNLDTITGSVNPPSYPGKLVHGPKGLGSYLLPRDEEKPLSNAVKWLSEIVVNSSEPIEIVALGPLTNIALAIKIEPGFVSNVKQLVFMGGVTDGPGNVLPLSTANIWNDPEAALNVFHAGFNQIVMVGQDVTRYARVAMEQERRLRRINSRVSKFLLAISDIYAQAYAKREPEYHGYPLHDLLAISYLIDKDAFTTEKLYVTVETDGIFTRGQTVADRRPYSPYSKQMSVCVGVDINRIFNTFFSRIESFDFLSG